MEREVGGGIGMGNTCKPMAVSFQCMIKFTTNKKIIIIILRKKNEMGQINIPDFNYTTKWQASRQYGPFTKAET